MRFILALLSSLLLVTAAVARPSLENRLARRSSRSSRPNEHIKREEIRALSNVTHSKLSSNWAGAVWDRGTGSFESVIGTFVVPTPKSPGGSNTHAASAWVGIDGDTCGGAILQTGIDFVITNGKVSYEAWYEWFPAFSEDFSGITIHAGDTIRLTVTAYSKTSGIAIIENLSRGQAVTKELSSSAALCQQNAEWIVEDYNVNGSKIPFANFGTVTFTSAKAASTSGPVGPAGATLVNIEQNGQILTSVSASDTSLTVKYV